MRLLRLISLSLAVLTAAASGAPASETMPLSQVRKGMKGHGLTVFEGNRVEKFDVEILGVLHNVGPGLDIILARVDSPIVRRAGVIAGMSGSPVIVDGKVIGALAFAWQFAREPVAGITPIEQMLKLASVDQQGPEVASASPRMTATEFLGALARSEPEPLFERLLSSAAPRPATTISGARPIAIPLSLSSFEPETLARFGKVLDAMNFVAVPSGAAAEAGEESGAAAEPFQPGDPIGAVLVNGDFTVAATGTVTHIDGNRVYAFGHPFLDMGPISFPMAKSEIVTVMPSLATSFKFANTGRVVGALRQDRATGIMGVVGERAEMIPLEVTVEGTGVPKTYRVNLVRHTQLSPLLLAMAADSVIANVQRAAGERTVLLESEIRIEGYEPILLREGWAGTQARQAIPAYLAIVSGYLMSNEFRNAPIESFKVRLRHDDRLRIAKLLEASVETPERGRISPGDTIRVRAVLKPFRGEPFVETFDVRIPDEQTPGPAHLLVGSGSFMNSVDFSLIPPSPRTLDQVLTVLRRLRPSTDLTVGLYTTGEGAVTAGVYLPSLPPTMRAVVSGDTSNGPQAVVKYHPAGHQARPLDYIVDGALKIDIEVKPTL
ncbi:MAG TPA: SpoIVB peptidase S55 domain-containing protein [Thermoanaerobaculia bacterium]|nr:SpoIVB peptidase S55 domain-containing protein [Thermoanaerobaculia bacterium]